MFIAVAFVMLLGAFGFIGWRLNAPSQAGIRGKSLAWAGLTLLLLCVLWFPAGIFLPVNLDPVGLGWLQRWIMFLAIGVFIILGLVVLARDALWLTLWGLGRLTQRIRERRGDPRVPSRPERREALRQVLNLGTLFATASVGAGAFVGARRVASVEQVEIPVAGLPRALEGFRIVQISDIHVGNTVTRPFVEEVVRCVNDLGADLIALTGDLTDGTVPQLRRHVEPLERLEARYGAFFVTGNHDYYFGQGEEWVAEARRLGMIALVNEHRLIEHGEGRLLVAGVPDYKAGDFVERHRSDPSAAIRGAPRADLRILLAHQPRSAAEAEAAGFDIQLSGHTHGGQIFPFHFAARLTQPVIAGLHRLGRLWVYVNRGTGYWGPPFRLFAPSEISLITLRRG